MQLEYANRNPSLIRQVLALGRLRRRLGGLHRADDARPGLRQRRPRRCGFTQLKFYLRAVANAILDHKMHCTAMTDEEALEVPDRGRVSVRRRSPAQDHPRQAKLGPALHLLRRPHGALPAAAGGPAGSWRSDFSWAATMRRCWTRGPVPVKYLPELVRKQLGLRPVAADLRAGQLTTGTLNP